jgi:hypothetical protein
MNSICAYVANQKHFLTGTESTAGSLLKEWLLKTAATGMAAAAL